MRVAFAGLGAMGRGMAGNLLKAGFEVAGYDVNPRAAAALTEAGGRACPGVAEACEGAGALVIMVVNAAQVEAVLDAAEGALAAGALVVCGSTVPPAEAVRLGARAEGRGWRYLDCPVSGGAAGAEAGTLTMMAAGSDAAWEAARPLLEAMGGRLFRLGDRPGAGSAMKMTHQLAAGCNLAVAAETLSFAAELGLDPAQVMEVIGVSAGRSWMMDDRGPRMLTEGREARSAVDIFVKDLGIVLDEARAKRFPAPVAAAAMQVFLGAALAGFAAHDDSQATRFYERLGARKVRQD